MSSGNSLGVYALIDRIQDVRFDFTLPRADVKVLGRFVPLTNRPIINYTPVSLTVNYIKGDKNVETCLGILNSTGIATLIGNGTQVTDYGARNYQVLISPVSTNTNMGEFDVVTGNLKSFSLAGTINEPVRGSFSIEGLDLQQVANNNYNTIPSYSGQVIRSQDVTITGINFSGLGYSGLEIQSFTFSTSFDYSNNFILGNQFPVRRMINGMATLQIDGYINGTTNTVQTLNQYQAGQFITGQYVFSLQPSCVGNQTPTTITLTNPYLTSQSFGVQVSNFIEVQLAFSCPLTIVPYEATGIGGTNVTIT